MDFLSLVAASMLTTASAETKPVYDYTYQANTATGIQTYSGTEFYERKVPEFKLGLFTQINDRWSVVNTLNTGTYTPKWKVTPALAVKVTRTFSLGNQWSLDLFASGTFGGNKYNTACVDSTGNQFHCYYGTQPSSTYFAMSYDEVDAITTSNEFATFTEIGFNLSFVF